MRNGYIRHREYTSVEVDLEIRVSDLLESATDSDIKHEALERRLFLKPSMDYSNPIKLKEHLCDIVQSGYHITKSDLLTKLNDLLC